MKSHYLDYRDSMMIEVSHENSVDVFAQTPLSISLHSRIVAALLDVLNEMVATLKY